MKNQSWILTISLVLLVLLISACAGGVAQESVRIATDATWPPFESINETTKHIEGFDIDLLNEVAKRGGFTVEFINVPFDTLLEDVALCKYDAGISSITITDERSKDMLFSNPYFSAGQVVVTRRENSEILGKDSLAGKTVGAQIDTMGASEVQKIQGAILKTFSEIDPAFKELLAGQIDAVVADNPLALDYVGKNPSRLKTVGTVFTEENYGIAVCKNNKNLLEKINKGLEKINQEGIIDQLTQKWFAGGQ